MCACRIPMHTPTTARTLLTGAIALTVMTTKVIWSIYGPSKWQKLLVEYVTIKAISSYVESYISRCPALQRNRFR